MKILVSAFACNPRLGSESYFGWSAVQCLARDHELWVMTTPRNRPDLEAARIAGQVPENIRFIYAGEFKEYHPRRLIAQMQGWKEFANFSKAILPLAEDLQRNVRFDVAHHLTLSSWRFPSPLWKLEIPFIFGPVGGNEKFPFRFFSILSPVAAGFELTRKFANVASSISPAVRTCLRRATHVFVANAETESLVIRLRGSTQGVSRLMAYFHSSANINVSGELPAMKSMEGPLRLFAGGDLQGRKGVALALHALARAKARGVKFRYCYGGRGAEFEAMQKLAVRLGLQGDVSLGENFSGEAYRRELRETHIYLLPSLRDSAGITLAEAMLAGCVPIVADCGGPGQLVSGDCGYNVPVTNPGALIERIAEIIVDLNQHRHTIQQKGQAAARRIAEHFTEENYRAAVNSVYHSTRC
jgi:glycosyltransferase involved in cell wall biosynthesis